KRNNRYQNQCDTHDHTNLHNIHSGNDLCSENRSHDSCRYHQNQSQGIHLNSGHCDCCFHTDRNTECHIQCTRNQIIFNRLVELPCGGCDSIAPDSQCVKEVCHHTDNHVESHFPLIQLIFVYNDILHQHYKKYSG